ncbi:MAG: hypothetical protein EBU59_10260 [Planctomycetia bacterium]|nr:hypothetical protein [Planctomycetia bacterium]
MPLPTGCVTKLFLDELLCGGTVFKRFTNGLLEHLFPASPPVNLTTTGQLRLRRGDVPEPKATNDGSQHRGSRSQPMPEFTTKTSKPLTTTRAALTGCPCPHGNHFNRGGQQIVRGLSLWQRIECPPEFTKVVCRR